MELSERNLLLVKDGANKLSLFSAIVCIVDVFGVFPVVTLPKAILDCGIYGILVIISVCSIQTYTAVLLGKCWVIAEKIEISTEKKNRYPYAALAEITYGRTFSNIVSFVLNTTIFCGGIPNLIVASQNLELLTLRLSSTHLNVSFCYWIIIIGMILCPVLWLGSPKDMKFLCSISVTIVILVFLFITGCLLSTPSESSSRENSFKPERPLWEEILISYGILSFQYDIHPSVLTIQVDMKEKTQINLALLGGFAIVTVIAAIKFGLTTQPSLLETLPTTFFSHMAALLVALQLCLSLAVSNSALFQHMEDCMSIAKEFNHRRCVLRTTLTLFSVLIAESVPRFDLVMSLIGGTLTGPLVFMLPPLFYLKMLSKEDAFMKKVLLETFVYSIDEETDSLVTEKVQTKSRKNKLEIVFCVTIITVSIFCTVMTTYVNVKNAIIFTDSTQSCILNVTTSLIF